MSGHDFASFEVLEVSSAVVDFCAKHKLQLYIRKIDWWIVKGRKRQKNLNDLNTTYEDIVKGIN